MICLPEQDWELIRCLLRAAEAEAAAWKIYHETSQTDPARAERRKASQSAADELQSASRAWAEYKRRKDSSECPTETMDFTGMHDCVIPPTIGLLEIPDDNHNQEAGRLALPIAG